MNNVDRFIKYAIANPGSKATVITAFLHIKSSATWTIINKLKHDGTIYCLGIGDKRRWFHKSYKQAYTNKAVLGMPWTLTYKPYYGAIISV